MGLEQDASYKGSSDTEAVWVGEPLYPSLSKGLTCPRGGDQTAGRGASCLPITHFNLHEGDSVPSLLSQRASFQKTSILTCSSANTAVSTLRSPQAWLGLTLLSSCSSPETHRQQGSLPQVSASSNLCPEGQSSPLSTSTWCQGATRTQTEHKGSGSRPCRVICDPCVPQLPHLLNGLS